MGANFTDLCVDRRPTICWTAKTDDTSCANRFDVPASTPLVCGKWHDPSTGSCNSIRENIDAIKKSVFRRQLLVAVYLLIQRPTTYNQFIIYLIDLTFLHLLVHLLKTEQIQWKHEKFQVVLRWSAFRGRQTIRHDSRSGCGRFDYFALRAECQRLH